MRKTKGFTLIELLITMAIIGILAAIAYPSYQNSLIKGNRAAAKAFMMEVAQRQTQYLLDQRAYASDIALLNLAPTPAVTRNYTVTVTTVAGPPAGFTVIATPITTSRQKNDGTLTLTNTGERAPADKW
ncbi:MAG TPA: type IV pilin protein [Verrucomicrobiae bacterium]|nr:type IV pilin protein [Verrucomicrobiae bacterium]